jgi:hypothetical protein
MNDIFLLGTNCNSLVLRPNPRLESGSISFRGRPDSRRKPPLQNCGSSFIPIPISRTGQSGILWSAIGHLDLPHPVNAAASQITASISIKARGSMSLVFNILYLTSVLERNVGWRPGRSVLLPARGQRENGSMNPQARAIEDWTVRKVSDPCRNLRALPDRVSSDALINECAAGPSTSLSWIQDSALLAGIMGIPQVDVLKAELLSVVIFSSQIFPDPTAVLVNAHPII